MRVDEEEVEEMDGTDLCSFVSLHDDNVDEEEEEEDTVDDVIIFLCNNKRTQKNKNN